MRCGSAAHELFADMDDPDIAEWTDAKSVKRTPIAEAFPAVGHKMLFLFDYGDDWRFVVEVIGRATRTGKPGISRCSRRSVKPRRSTAGTRRINDPTFRNRGKPSAGRHCVNCCGVHSHDITRPELEPVGLLEWV